jgi:hydroxymethylpyrimidine/phosphomethylpyrimidine kinase
MSISRDDRPPIVLSIGGSDPSSGSGVQADILTFASLGVYGTSVITAITAQNTLSVGPVLWQSPEVVAGQLDLLLADLPPQAAKTGLLGPPEQVRVITERLRAARVGRLVVDPIWNSSTGGRLYGGKHLGELKETIFPLAALITPNLEEAGKLVGRPVRNEAEMERAARELCQTGARAVLITGGHLPGLALDVLWDGSRLVKFSGERKPGPDVRGTGCALSAAITAYLARGAEVAEAVFRAKHYVHALLEAPLALGGGLGLRRPLFVPGEAKRVVEESE